MFTQFEREQIGLLLDEASSAMSNNCCNDFPIKVTEDNISDVVRLIQEQAADHDEDWLEFMMADVKVGHTMTFCDYMLVAMFERRIKNAPPIPRVITRDNAQAYLEEVMLDFIEAAGNFPDIKVQDKAWQTLLVYCPLPLLTEHLKWLSNETLKGKAPTFKTTET